MFAIPLTAAILIIGLLFLQYNHYRHLERQKSLDKTLSTASDFEDLKKDFAEYKKRVDGLTIKAGFKL